MTWKCDRCGKVIASRADAVAEYYYEAKDGGDAHGFVIVHNPDCISEQGPGMHSHFRASIRLDRLAESDGNAPLDYIIDSGVRDRAEYDVWRLRLLGSGRSV